MFKVKKMKEVKLDARELVSQEVDNAYGTRYSYSLRSVQAE